MEIREVEIKRILNPTSIDLGEYVINPYRGCEFSCLYCYVRYNKVTAKDKRCWGDYVDIRVNAPALLERELALRKPQRVLLGSTTECFQPVEERWRISRKVLEILTRHKVFYTILTRSPLVLDVLPLLKEGYCRAIYFTVNQYDESLKSRLEPKSPPFERRIETVRRLLEEGVPVIPYFSPVLPYISDFTQVFTQCERAGLIEFEGLNFNLGSISEIIKSIGSIDPQWGTMYREMAGDARRYDQVFSLTKKDIVRQAIRARKNHRVFIHTWASYFKNTYREQINALEEQHDPGRATRPWKSNKTLEEQHDF